MSFFIETSWGSLLKWGEELCGDRVELVKQEDGVLLVLSDGLGSGVKANILAGLTSKIITSMVTAGAELKDVVDTIAFTLPVCKVREVAYSTFTMMQVDHEGNAYLVEFDNPTVILLRNGKRVFIPWVEQNISGKQIREAHLKLKLGDIAVTFSDGIIHAGVGRLLNLGWQHENVVQFLEETWQADDTAYDVQHRLLNECNSLYQGHPGDDTTVAALRICVPNPCCVMVGPPVHPEDDEEVVGELLACPGIKVICGGTTSQIVSKRLGKELKILLQYISPDVPPIATMEGIDLVTEGVVTLGKTLEILEQYEETKDPELLIAKKDGAHLLAETLVEKCTSVKFIVGRALNPAHQNPDMPISLSIKLRLVKDISECLKRLGKPTTLKYC
mgnify:FL=1